MNIVRTSGLVNRPMLLAPLLAVSLLLSACGGSDNKNNSASSSSSSSSAHSLTPTPITESGSGVWPDIKISASDSKTLDFAWNSAPASTHYKLLKKADANGLPTQVGVDIPDSTSSGTASTSDSVSINPNDWVNNRYIVQACSASACVNSNEILLSAMPITYIKASNADADDWFGWSIALSGDGQTLAVGAPAEDSEAKAGDVNKDESNNASPNSGAVYVFKKTNGSWLQEAYLKASNTEQHNEDSGLTLPNDRFGYQIALSADGNTLAVSATQEDSPSRGINCDENDLAYPASSAASANGAHVNFNIGAVYIFKRSDNLWAKTTYVKPHDPVLDLQFGNSLSLSGDGKRLAVGTYKEGSYRAGIFDSRSLSSSACIDFSASSISSSSSSSLLSSSTSSASSSLVGGSESGGVYLFKETDAGWIEEAVIKAADADAGDLFGTSISLSQDGNTLAAGAPAEDSKDSGPTNDKVTVGSASVYLNNGGVYIFANTNDTWTQQAKVKPYDNGIAQQFGFSVALSGDGNTLAVGAPGDWSKSSGIEAINAGAIGALGSNYDLTATISSFATGAAYIFTKDAESWIARAYLKASNAKAGNQFGSSVALSKDGGVLAVGSTEEASRATGINGDQIDTAAKSAGAAYLFQLTGTSWAQTSYVKASNTSSNDRFAHALSLDDSGTTLAVGAHRESSNATGINGDQTNDLSPATGAVYLF